MITIPTSARIAGSALCSWGTGGDPANGCDNVALPGFDLCPPHERISQYLERVAAQQPMSVRIDVCDDDNLVEEALAAGCTAVEATDGYRKYHLFVVHGPQDKLLPLLASWGYDYDGYEVIEDHHPDVCTANGTYETCAICQHHVPVGAFRPAVTK